MKTLRESILDIDSVQSSIEPISLINDWCKKNIKGRYKIDPKTLDIDSNGSIEIVNKNITEFPTYIHFGKVRGDFNCNCCEKLISLQGAPKKVGGYFCCTSCYSLTALEGAPKKVGRTFNCAFGNSLQSLEGAPEKVDGDFICSYCKKLTSLEGAPKEVNMDFYCWDCGKQFTADDIKKVCNVGGNIVIKG